MFDPANATYWIFLAVGVLLFLLIIISGGGDDDADFSGDTDLDLDTDADVEMGLGAILGWLGFGRAPLLLLLATDFSVWGLTGWFLNTIASELTGTVPDRWFGLGGAILLVSLGLSLFVGSLSARAIGQMFASFSEDTSSERLIGCEGKVTSATIPKGRIGQVDAIDPQGNRVTLSATLPDWAEQIPQRGTDVVVIDRQPQAYVVIAKEGSDRDRWLAEDL